MPDNPSIDDLIRRVRAGDQDAASELVKRYEPAIRRAVRFHYLSLHEQRPVAANEGAIQHQFTDIRHVDAYRSD